MKRLGISSACVLIILLSSCSPTPTPYVSNIDPCDPDILTAIAASGAIPRCDKIPTARPQTNSINIEKEREFEIITFLNKLIDDPRYDPSQQVLAKYIDSVEVDIEDNALHFHISPDPTNADDAISLAAELIHSGTLISHAGESGDWNLGIIDVNYVGNSDTCGVSLYVNSELDLAKISQGSVSVYDVMESFVCELNGSAPNQPSTTEVLLCKDTSKMAGNIVNCKIPRAYCSYQPTTSGEPTFCNDALYPNHNFTLFVWGEDWSDYDGKCIIVSGEVLLYQGKPQIEGFGRSQISSCP